MKLFFIIGFPLLSWMMGEKEIHPVHISVTDIQYSEKDKTLQIICKHFVDDFETVVRQQIKNELLDLLKPAQGKADDYVQNYLQTCLSLKVNGKLLRLRYIGYEKEDLSLVSYWETEKIKKISSLEVKQLSFLELYDDQSNLVHFTYQDETLSARLTQNQKTATFTPVTKKK